MKSIESKAEKRMVRNLRIWNNNPIRFIVWKHKFYYHR